MKRDELLTALDELLRPQRYRDYTINGLQVAGRSTIERIVTAVTASQAAIEHARADNADALLVHHGYFWKGEDSAITGIKRQRLAALLDANINLIAYHLPLDQHPELGNNCLFANHFPVEHLWQSTTNDLIWHATIPPTSPSKIATMLKQSLPTDTLQLISDEPERRITHIAWCSGAANDFLTQAHDEGAELYISGEYAERNYHEARELGCAFIACGHHASERAGIRTLGTYLEREYGLTQQFFDEPNPF